MNIEPIKLDPPGVVFLKTKNEKGELQISKFPADLVSLPDPDRNDGFLWVEKDGVMLTWYRQDEILGWEIHT